MPTKRDGADRGLEQRAEDVEGEHVEAEVQEARRAGRPQVTIR